MNAILPSMTSLTLNQVMSMDLRGYQLTQKLDGVTDEIDFEGLNVVGERMPDGGFFAFDVRLELPLVARWNALGELSKRGLSLVPSGHGKEFIEALWQNADAEGIVLKNWQSGFGYDWAKCKKQETFDVRVVSKLQGAVAIEYQNQDAGKCAVSGLNYDLIQVGSIIEISAMKRNVSGKFREPRFLRIRFDKN